VKRELRKVLDEQKKALWELQQLLFAMGYTLTVLQELSRSLGELNKVLEEVCTDETKGDKSG